MRVDDNFRDAYRALEITMRALAESEGDIFLPNLAPDRPVDYVLVCMEPSLGRWAKSRAEANSRIEVGFRNFASSMEDFILHFCARRYLCEAQEHYHITDLSKGAMLVDRATRARSERWDRWYPLLEKELNLISNKGTGIVAVGRRVAEYLQAKGKHFTRVIHYSSQAAGARKAGVVGREREFEAFKDSISVDDLLRDAESVLVNAGLPAAYRDATLSKLATSNLSESRRQLIFTYKTAFKSVRYGRDERLPNTPMQPTTRYTRGG